MNSYILLRDNKESGSLSLADLQQIRLKSTDLIWIECQSVGWRNPHEIKELKDLLDSPTVIPVTPIVEHTDIVTPIVAIKEAVPDTVARKNLVYVELPAKPVPGKKQTEQLNTLVKEDLPDHYQYAGLTEPVKNTTIEKTVTTGKADPVITKYTRPLDEIKEMYVQNMQERKKTGITLAPVRLPKELKKILVYSGLVLSGALVMFLFRSKGGKAPVSVVQNPKESPTIPINKDTVIIQPSPAGVEATIPVSTISSYRSGEETPVASAKNSPAEKRTTIVDQDTEQGNEASEKIKTNTEETSVAKTTSTESLSTRLSLKANDFSIGSFGGIKNLEMTLQNDSRYLLDKVDVEIRYLNPEGMTILTDDIHFKSVYPGAAETVPVKKSRRGVKIAYKITRIESKEIGGSTTGL
ncbi:MAG: hypothetical protein ABIT05_03695 [Chitinophagaceae bacterium]